MTENNEGISTWNGIVATLMSMPGIKVNRNQFLTEKLSLYCNEVEVKNAIEMNPLKAGINSDILDAIADGIISYHTNTASSLSFVAGLPGGPAVLATIPADIANYYYHTFVVAQKLAYIYGFPNLIDENGKLNDDAIGLLTLFVGVMAGVATVNEALNAISKQLAAQVVKRLPQKALTKTAVYPIVKQVGKWIGVSVTKQSFAKQVGKIIPVIGGVISGGLTYVTFKPSAQRLKKTLQEKSVLFRNSQTVNTEPEVENAQYEVVD